MANAKKAARYVSDPEPVMAASAGGGQADSADSPALHLVQPDEAAALCATCGELLAWHEQPCQAGPAPAEAAEGSVVYYASGPSYAFDLGQRVQAAFNTTPHQVIWRGQLKERNAATGLVHRVNVYWLNDGHWDCYREEDLRLS